MAETFSWLNCSRLEGSFHFIHQRWKLGNALITARYGTSLEFASVPSDISFRCIRTDLVLDLVLALEDAARQHVLEALQLALHILLSTPGRPLALLDAPVDVLHVGRLVVAAVGGAQMHPPLVAAQVVPVNGVDKVLDG